jgi:hypothetical protein
MNMKLRAAVGVGVLLTCLWTTTCTRQTPGNPSSDQAKQSSRAENPPPNPAPAPTAVEEAKPQAPAPPQAPKAPAPSAQEPVAAEKPSPKPPAVLPAGTVLTVRTTDAISAKSSQVGQNFQAVIAQPVALHGHTVIPAGSTVTGKIVQAKQGGKIKGGSELALQLATVHVHGVSYPITTDQYSQEAKGKGKRTTAMGAGGAGLGAVIGGIAGGGKGAAIGAVAGGGAGVAGSAMTGNKELTIPAESVLSFTLSQALKISSHAAPNSADESNQ